MVFLGAFQYVTLFVYSISLFTNLRVGSLRRLIRFITYSMQTTQSRAFIHPWRRLYEWHFLCSYLLNPCVDAKYVIFCGFGVPFSLKKHNRKAKDLPPSPIRNTTAPLFTSFSTRMTRMFDGFPYPFSRGSPRSASPAGSVDAQRRDSGFELGGQTEVLLGSREERRWVNFAKTAKFTTC